MTQRIYKAYNFIKITVKLYEIYIKIRLLLAINYQLWATRKSPREKEKASKPLFQ